MSPTETAQRRLLEAIAEQGKVPAGIEGMRLAFPIAIEMAEATGQPVMANVWRRLGELLEAVHNDLTGVRQ